MKKIMYINIFFVLLTNISFGQNQINHLKRDPEKRKDVANVFYKSQYTLFDLSTDEPIFTDSKGIYTIYTATNENKIPKKLVVSSKELMNCLVYKFKTLQNCKNWCEGKLANDKKTTSANNTIKGNHSYTKSTKQNNSKISSLSNYNQSTINDVNSKVEKKHGHKFCYDDTYGSSGMKLEITLYDDGQVLLEYKRDGEVVRRGNGNWSEGRGITENSIVTIELSNGTLSFNAVKSLTKTITMLIDSRENIYNQCF